MKEQQDKIFKSKRDLLLLLALFTALSSALLYVHALSWTLPRGLFGQFFHQQELDRSPFHFEPLTEFPHKVRSKYAAIWTGWLYIEHPGIYRFYAENEPGVSLAINDKRVLLVPPEPFQKEDMNAAESDSTPAEQEVPLIQDCKLITGFHKLEIHLRGSRRNKNSKLSLLWSQPNTKEFSELPLKLLFPEKPTWNGIIYEKHAPKIRLVCLIILGLSLIGTIYHLAHKSVRHDIYFFMIAVACMIVYGYHLMKGGNNCIPVDDAFISLRYATNLAEGRGLIFNPNEYVEGYTNFLWTLILAGFVSLKLNPVLWAQLSGLFFNVVTFFLLFRISVKHFHQTESLWPLKYLALFGLALNPFFMNWSVNGLETPLVAALLLGAIYCYLEKGLSFLTCFLFVCAFLTRPDSVIVFLVTYLFDMISNRKVNILPLVYVSLLYFPVFLWKYSYYGYPLPNTYYAKAGLGPYAVNRGLRYMWGFIYEFHRYYLLLGCLTLFSKKIFKNSLYLLLTVGAFTAGIIKVGGDFMYGYRFFVPLIPLVLLLIQEGIITVLKVVRTWSAPKLVHTALPLIAFIIVGYCATLHFQAYPFGGRDKHWWIGIHRDLGNHMKVNSHPYESVATSMIGAISYYSGLITFDILGLTDEYLAHLPGDQQPFDCQRIGAGKTNPEYILSKRPKYIVFGAPIPAWDAAIYFHTRFADLYQRHVVSMQNFQYYSLYQRRD